MQIGLRDRPDVVSSWAVPRFAAAIQIHQETGAEEFTPSGRRRVVFCYQVWAYEDEEGDNGGIPGTSFFEYPADLGRARAE